MNALVWTLIALGMIGLATLLELIARWQYRRRHLLPFRPSQAVKYPWEKLLKSVPGPLAFHLPANTDWRPLLHINRWGLRGGDPAPDGQKHRIWVMGESDCFGVGLRRESDLWLYRLQALLEERGFDDYEVANLSLGGYSNAQRLALWKQMPALPGDILLLRPGFQELVTCAGIPVAACPLTAAPKPPAAGGTGGWRRWMGRSACMRLLAEAWPHKPMASPGQAPPAAVSQRTCWNGCRESILLTVEEIAADAEAQGVQPAVMSFFPAYQLEMTAADRRRLGTLETPDCRLEMLPVAEQFDLMDATVERLVCQKGLPLIDLAPAFWQRPDRFGLYFDLVHLNAAGQRVLAETLFAELCRAGLLKHAECNAFSPCSPLDCGSLLPLSSS